MIRVFAIALSLALPAARLYAETPPSIQVTWPVNHDKTTSLRFLNFLDRLRHPFGLETLRWFQFDVSRSEIPEPWLNVRAFRDSVAQVTAVAGSEFIDEGDFEGLGAGVKDNAQSFQRMTGPADSVGAAGPDDYVQWVSRSLAVFSKRGELKLGPMDGNVVWSGFAGDCGKQNDGDPIIVFDRLADRWILTQLAKSDSHGFHECIAVSMSNDPTGGYYRYDYYFEDFNDYPKFAVWGDAYYATYNMFGLDEYDQAIVPHGSQVCAYDRKAMLGGEPAAAQCVAVATQHLQPVGFDGKNSPPPHTPAFLLSLDHDQRHLSLWRFHVDWKRAERSTFRKDRALRVATFTPACPDAPCVFQPTPETPLAGLGDRLMFRASYRRRGNVESIYATHSVSMKAFGGGEITAVRWYEIRDPRHLPRIYQQATYNPGPESRWMASMASDKEGNIAIGFNIASPSVYPSISLAGRKRRDRRSTLRREIRVKTGKGTYLETRWGDYTSMTVDPVDDCTFWFTAAYLGEPEQTDRWHTRIVHARLNDCR